MRPGMTPLVFGMSSLSIFNCLLPPLSIFTMFQRVLWILSWTTLNASFFNDKQMHLQRTFYGLLLSMSSIKLIAMDLSCEFNDELDGLRRINRVSLIRLVGFDGHCSPQPSRCDVWINNNYEPVGDQILTIGHGTYVRISIPSHPDEPESPLMLCAKKRLKKAKKKTPLKMTFLSFRTQIDIGGSQDMSAKQVSWWLILTGHVISSMHNQLDARLGLMITCPTVNLRLTYLHLQILTDLNFQFGDVAQCLDALRSTWVQHLQLIIFVMMGYCAEPDFLTQPTSFVSNDLGILERSMLVQMRFHGDCSIKMWNGPS